MQVPDDKAVNTITASIDPALGNQYEIINVEEKTIKMILIGVESKDLKKPDEDILQLLVNQNSELKQCDVQSQMVIVKKYLNAKNESKGNIIFEVKLELFNKIGSIGKLYTGFKYCRFTKYINIIRCYTCFRFSHIKARCRFRTTCGICAENHDPKDCPENSKKCINCLTANEKENSNLQTDHSSFDKRCPSYIKLVDRLANKGNL